MQKEQTVNYYADPDADARTAYVVDIVGAGPSLAKRLDLRYREAGKDHTADDVPHEADAEEGKAFWLMHGERRTRKTEEVEDDSPPALAVPDEAREQPAVRKAASKTATKHGK